MNLSGLYSNASATSSALASQLYTSSNCCPQLPAAQQLEHYHKQQQQQQTQQQQQQQQQEQQCLTDGIDASITFINSFLGTDVDRAALDANRALNTAEIGDGMDLMQELLGVINDSDLAAAQAYGTSQQHGLMWPASTNTSVGSGPQTCHQQQHEHSLQDEACLVAETPAAWAAAAAAETHRIQQHQQYNQQQYNQHQCQQHQPMQPTIIPATWLAGAATGASAVGVATSAPGIATSSIPTPEAPGLLFAAATGGSTSSTGTPALLSSLLPSPFIASASINMRYTTGGGGASSSCLSNTDITEALRRASAEQARQQQQQQQSIGPGQQQQQLQHSWSAPHLAAATAAGMTASGWWCGDAAANSTLNMASGHNSSSLSAFDLSRTSSTPCLSLQQQQQLLAQELFLAQQQQRCIAAMPQQQLEVQRLSEHPESRKSSETRKPTDQISSKCSKLFRPRRPQVVPAAAPDLVISDRVKARMQWLHQQRHQQQRTARRQQQQQRSRPQLDEHK